MRHYTSFQKNRVDEGTTTNPTAGAPSPEGEETMSAFDLTVGEFAMDVRGGVWLRESASLLNVLKGGRVPHEQSVVIGTVMPLFK